MFSLHKNQFTFIPISGLRRIYLKRLAATFTISLEMFMKNKLSKCNETVLWRTERDLKVRLCVRGYKANEDSVQSAIDEIIVKVVKPLCNTKRKKAIVNCTKYKWKRISAQAIVFISSAVKFAQNKLDKKLFKLGETDNLRGKINNNRFTMTNKNQIPTGNMSTPEMTKLMGR